MASFQKSTHRELTVGHGLKLEIFHPETNFATFEGLEHPASLASVGIKHSAVSFLQSQLKIPPSDISYNSGYATGTTTHAYLKQCHNGVPFANAVANITWKGDKVVAFGSSFVEKTKIAHSEPTIDVQAIIPKAEQTLNGIYNGHPPTVKYLVRPDSSISLVHVVQIENDKLGTWYEAFVDAHSGDILSVTDFVCEVSYTVLPITNMAPDTSLDSNGFETLTDPQDMISSPSGWHTITTAGNNVVAYKAEDKMELSCLSSPPGITFNYPFDPSQDPTTAGNLNAARVNAFYVINTVHDFAFRYGFTEAAFNFQEVNFSGEGKGGDRVMMSVQDASGYDNANFASPPDGQPGKCRMYIWNKTDPRRDGDLVNSMIVHEMTHGITNRMIGGGTGSSLQTLESRGLGEGWSDAMAEWTEQKSATVSDYVMGLYVNGGKKSSRKYPYSTNPKTNPLRYKDVGKFNNAHRIGEIWANMLHNVYAALVGKHGFSSTAMTNPDGTEGNVVFLHHFIDSLQILCANPTFINARDAWIKADEIRYDSANKCLLWKVFASRGLGLNAMPGKDGKYDDNDDCPADCNCDDGGSSSSTDDDDD